MSPPLYTQSNGKIFRAVVETMKAKLDKCDDEYLVILSYRDTFQLVLTPQFRMAHNSN